MANYLDLTGVKQNFNIDYSDDDAIITGLMELAEELVLTDIQGTVTGVGTVATDGSSGLTGTDTFFTSYTVGDTIKVDGAVIQTITAITDDTHLTVSGTFTSTSGDLGYVMHPGIPSPVPNRLKQAMMMMVGHFYSNREATIAGVTLAKIPYGYDYLIEHDKNWTVT